MDQNPSGSEPEWIRTRVDQYPSGSEPEWIRTRVDPNPSGSDPEWIRTRVDQKPEWITGFLTNPDIRLVRCSAQLTTKGLTLNEQFSGFDTAKLKRSLRRNAAPLFDNPKQQAEPRESDTKDAEMILTMKPFNLHKNQRFNNRCKAVCIVFTTKQLHLGKTTTINEYLE